MPTLALTAFGGSPGKRTSETARAAAWAGAKVAPHASAVRVSALAQRRAVERLIRLQLPVYCAGSRGRYVALTFDDGPSVLTPQFHALLRRAGARATFFIVGGNMPSPTLAALARKDAQVGALGDHTWSHANLKDLPEADVVAEIGRAKKAIVAATHAPVLLFRPPFAGHSATVGAVARSMGMLEILWNVDSRDWSGIDWRKITDNVAPGLEPGSIILMHDTRSETVKALRYGILPELRLRGLKAVTLPELFALDPPSEEQVRADAARGACSHQYGG